MTDPALHIDKIADGDVVCLKLEGTIDEHFDGKKLASGLAARALVLDLGEVRKISSFGIREWVDFVQAAGERVQQIVLVDCAPKVVDQLNMVANFAGSGHVYSAYAPYRCDYCDADRRVLLQADRDDETIRRMRPGDRPCPTCGNVEYFDEDPQSFFSYLAQQPAFELDPAVARFLATHLAHSADGAGRRLRVEKQVFGRITHMRLDGDVTGAIPADKIAEGLEGTVILDVHALGQIDPPGAAAWRQLMSTIGVTCERVLLAGCPAGFLERLGAPEDRGKAAVLSCALPYTCPKCALTAAQALDVPEHAAVLAAGEVPARSCKECGGETRCDASPALREVLRRLGEPPATGFDDDQDVRRALELARAPRVPAPPPVAPRAPARNAPSSGILLLVGGAAAALVVVGIFVGKTYLSEQQAVARVAARDAVGALVARSEPARPAWITSDIRGFAACSGEAELACVGVSMYADDAESARGQAYDAALEALAGQVALAVGRDRPAFRTTVVELYEPARQLALRGLETTRDDQDGERWRRALDGVIGGRRAVAAALTRTGGAAVPAQPAALYHEQYADAPGVNEGNRHLAFVRVVVTPAELAELVARYGKPVEVLGATVSTFFPGAAWRYPTVTEGAFVMALGQGRLRDVGLAPQDVILEVQGRRVADADAFAAELAKELALAENAGGAVKLTVKSGDGPPRIYSINVSRVAEETPGVGPRRGSDRPRSGGSTGINVWDRTGGGDVKDDPDQ